MPPQQPVRPPGTPSHPPHRHARRKEARPGELLDAALDLFVERGYAATRVEAVAARAGVSKGTLFLYFPSKEELFKAVVRENITGRFQRWNEEFETFEGSTADMVRYCYASWWEHIGATRASGITKLMLSEAGNFPEITRFYQQEVIQPGHQLVRRVLERGMACGEFRVLDLDYAVYAVLAPLMFLVMGKHSMAACTSASHIFCCQAYLEMQLDILLSGLCGASPAAPAKPAPAS